jgi:hypothetical protein
VFDIIYIMSFYPDKHLPTFDGVKYYQLSSNDEDEPSDSCSVEAEQYYTTDVKKSRFCTVGGVFVGLLMLFYVVLSSSYSYSAAMLGSSSNGLFYSIDDICKSGTFRDPQSQLKPFLWNPFSPKSSQKLFPVYWTLPLSSSHSLSTASSRIRKAIIVQHGNLRNGNDYFCSAVEAIQQINASSPSFDSSSFIIIAPQFLIEGDLCWNPTLQQFQTIDLSEGVDCGQYVWDSSGWKDGKSPLNMLVQSMSDSSMPLSLFPPVLSSPSPSSTQTKRKIREPVEITENQFFSFDIFNLLINQLLDDSTFPNLYEVTLFGFSAGGQTLLRYSLYPNYNETSIIRSQNLLSDDDDIKDSSKKVEEIAKKVLFRQEKEGSKEARVAVRTVVGDISSYLYFDERRPFINSTAGFAVPDKQWITQWKVIKLI